MTKTRGPRFVLTAMIIMVGFVVFILHAGTGSTTSGDEVEGVRMAVDPTVLPMVPPPGAPEPSAAQDMAGQDATAPLEGAGETPTAMEDPAQQKATPKPAAAPSPTSKSTSAPSSDSGATQAKHAGKGTVSAIAVDATDREFILTVTCDRPVGDTSYMNLKNPSRLVIDLRQPWTLKAKNVIRVDNGPIKHVVVGSHPDRLRLVVHFNSPPKGKLAPSFARAGNKLIISVALP